MKIIQTKEKSYSYVACVICADGEQTFKVFKSKVDAKEYLSKYNLSEGDYGLILLHDEAYELSVFVGKTKTALNSILEYAKKGEGYGYVTV